MKFLNINLLNKILLLCLLLFSYLSISAQTGYSSVSVNSTCGYSVSIVISPVAVVPSSSSCTSGYNYDIKFNYTITVTGVNTCYNGSIGIQPEIYCNSKNSGYYTIMVNAPTVGNASTTSTYSGTYTTGTNQFRSASDCATSTPQSLNCTTLKVNIYGPGISNITKTTTITYTSVLPVELTSFTGECTDNGVEFFWNTASEHNNDFFTISSSTDGINWSKVATVTGNGNSTVSSDYHFVSTDRISNTTYYRLYQTDFDGTSTLEKTISVAPCQLNFSDELTLYPNPTTGYFTLSIDYKNSYNVNVTDAGGRIIYQEENATAIDLSGYDTGIYMIHVKLDNGHTLTKRISLIK